MTSTKPFTFSHLIEAINAGHRPVVQFNAAIASLESYAEKGMWARIIGARLGNHEVVHLTFDFIEFEERNRPFETASFYGPGGGGLLTAREAGQYKVQDRLVFDAPDEVSLHFGMEATKALDLFRVYASSGVAVSIGYVRWLEERVLSYSNPLTRDLQVLQAQSSSAPEVSFASTPPNLGPDYIHLCGAFSVLSCTGQAWPVDAITVDKTDFIADVYVRLGQQGAFDAKLYNDKTFVAGIMDKLKTLGYGGGSFGCAELGMQDDACIILEPCKEFEVWVTEKGFVKLLD